MERLEIFEQQQRNSSKQVPFYCRLCLHVVLGASLGHRHPDEIGFWQ